VIKKLERASILIVDDSPHNLRLLEDILTPSGYKLFFATNGKNALTIAQQKKPNLILLDILMPDLSGYEVCEKLKKSLATRSIPVIFVSALSSIEEKVRALEVGGTDFIAKPFDPVEIKARIVSNLSRARMLLKADYLLKQTYHELNTPLCIIDTAVSLQKKISGESKYLDNISAASKTLHNIYKDLYFFIQDREYKETDEDSEELNLLMHLQERLNYFEVIAKTNKLTIELRGSEDAPKILIGEMEFERLIDNLISNAIRYSKKETSIDITLSSSPESLIRIENIVASKENKTTYKSSIPGIGFDIVNTICKENNLNISFSIENNRAEVVLSYRRID